LAEELVVVMMAEGLLAMTTRQWRRQRRWRSFGRRKVDFFSVTEEREPSLILLSAVANLFLAQTCLFSLVTSS
jgi:hypothetical protein